MIKAKYLSVLETFDDDQDMLIVSRSVKRLHAMAKTLGVPAHGPRKEISPLPVSDNFKGAVTLLAREIKGAFKFGQYPGASGFTPREDSVVIADSDLDQYKVGPERLGGVNWTVAKGYWNADEPDRPFFYKGFAYGKDHGDSPVQFVVHDHVAEQYYRVPTFDLCRLLIILLLRVHGHDRLSWPEPLGLFNIRKLKQKENSET